MENKQGLAFVMSFLVLLSCCAFPAAVHADDGEQQEQNQEALAGLMDPALVEKLTALGVMTDDPDADYSSEVTRGGLAKIIVRYLNYADMPLEDSEVSPFIDVGPFHEAGKEIRLLYQLGVISGSGSRRFEPDRPATYDEAMIMLLNSMGYKGFAISKGAGSSGYRVIANQNDLLAGLGGSGEQAIPLRDVYVMLDNSLDVPLCIQTGFGDTPEYELMQNTTPLSYYYKIQMKRGVVTGNGSTRLMDPVGLGRDEQLEIDHVTYQTPGKNDADLLGLRVEYYIRMDGDTADTVVFVQEQKNKNQITELAAEDITGAEQNRIEYLPTGSGAARTLAVSDSVQVVYNGRAYLGYGTLREVIPKSGTVTAVSNDGDQTADVLFIKSFQNVVIHGVDSEEEIVYDRDTNQEYSLNSTEYDIKLYGPDGKAIRLKALQEWDILTLMESRNKTGRLLKTGYVSRTTVAGKVSEVYSQAGEEQKRAVIEGQSYYFARNFTDEVKPGMTGTFYLDYEGKIAAYQSGAVSGTMYAVLVGTAMEKTLSGTIRLKLFTQDGKMAVYDAADKLEINGVRYTVSYLVQSGAGQLPKDGSVIRFRLRDGDKVSYIDSGASGAEGDLTLIGSGTNIKVRYNMVSGKAVISEDTVIFGMPKTLPGEDDDYSLLTVKTFTQGTSYGNTEYGAYNLGDSEIGMATVLYVKGMRSGSQASGSAFGVVTEISEGITDEGDRVKVVSMMRGSAILELPVKEDSLLEGQVSDGGIKGAGVQPGDVIRVGTNTEGMINEVATIFNFDGKAEDGAALSIGGTVDTNAGTFDAEYRAVYGTVESVEGDYMKFSTGEGETLNYGVCNIASVNIAKYYSDTHTAVSLKQTDLIRGDRFVMRLNLGTAKEIIVLK